MWPVRIEMLGVAVQDGAGVGFVVDQQVVGALPADAADEPFGIAVRPGRAWRDLDDLHAYRGEHRVERGGELCVAVPDQEPERAGSVVEIDDQVAACCVVQSPVGWAVTPRMCTLRVSTSITIRM